MIGLIKKDLLMTKSSLKMILIMFIVFTLMGVEGNTSMIFIPLFMSIVLMMSTFSYDEYNKTDAFICTLPNGRTNSVQAKYISSILIIVTSLIITLIIAGIIALVNKNINWDGFIETSIGCAAGIILIQTIMYPIIYKFGIEKSRIGLFVGAFGFSGIIAILAKNIKLSIPTPILSFLDKYFLLLGPLILVLIIYISYRISKKIYLKKEF